ncbi:MAG: putative glycoside hydrolase [Cellulosilyticum sp.]|nr:putative glycoside hydrolase [Cellulosilyticum sp.]
MKKIKLGAVSSYYQYQVQKIRKKEYKVLFLIGVLLVGTFIVTGRFDEDLQGLLSIGRAKIETIEQSVYLEQPSINYSIYVAPKVAKGIYIPNSKINNYEEYIELAKETEINSFVIDVKDDMGYLTFATDNQDLRDKGIVLDSPPIKDIQAMMNRLCEANIYPIARVVAFKDGVVAKNEPQRAIKKLDGTTYVTRANDTWLNPYLKENWEYLLEVSREAVRMGFKEIQFDYVRFHESMNSSRVILDDEVSKSKAITEFTKYICKNLQKEGIKVSADVFGAVVLSDIDAEIVGQDFKEMSKYLDYICPMVYPSHYAEGTFGIEYPHLDPYHIIYKTMKYGLNKIESEEAEKRAIVRPWLQDFTIKSCEPYLEYGPEQIKAQIEGAKEAGVEEWLLWNAVGNYTIEGLKTQ